jgi:acyl carrier protein
MTGHLDRADRGRLGQQGMIPLSNGRGLQLFDAAFADADPVIITAQVDTAALRASGPEELPPLLRGLVRATGRRVAAGGASPDTTTQRLRALPAAERHGFLLQLVTAHVATVLGHETPDGIDPDVAFKDLGFDSLRAVELRNRLNAATGLRLATTVVFDNPSPAALAGLLLEQLAPEDADGARDLAALGELDRLEAEIGALPPGSEDYRKVVARLLRLVRRVGGRATAGGETADGSQDLTSATDEELFAALDDELGTG